jgi:hypothetical protein
MTAPPREHPLETSGHSAERRSTSPQGDYTHSISLGFLDDPGGAEGESGSFGRTHELWSATSAEA